MNKLHYHKSASASRNQSVHLTCVFLLSSLPRSLTMLASIGLLSTIAALANRRRKEQRSAHLHTKPRSVLPKLATGSCVFRRSAGTSSINRPSSSSHSDELHRLRKMANNKAQMARKAVDNPYDTPKWAEPPATTSQEDEDGLDCSISENLRSS